MLPTFMLMSTPWVPPSKFAFAAGQKPYLISQNFGAWALTFCKNLGATPNPNKAKCEFLVVKVACSENEVVRPVTPNPDPPHPLRL